MYLSQFCGGIFFGECCHSIMGNRKKMNKFTKLYILGEEKMERELNVFKIIKY
jgi:hypothetical protein